MTEERTQSDDATSALSSDDRQRWNRIAFFVIVVLAGTVIGLDYFVHLDPHFHPHFDREKLFGFYGGCASLASIAMLLAAKFWGWIAWREEDYYERDSKQTT